MKRSILFVLLFNLVIFQSAYAGEAFEFATAAIDSLEWAAEARQELKQDISTQADKEDPNVGIFKSMIAARKTIKKIEMGSSMIKPFKESRNELIKTAANFYLVSYGILKLDLLAYTTFLEKSQNMKLDKFESNSGTVSSEGRRLIANIDTSWKHLLQCAVVTTYALTDQQRKEDGKLCCLAISTGEKNVLLKTLELTFGEKIKKNPKGGEHATEAAPALLWRFLNKGMKTSDAN